MNLRLWKVGKLKIKPPKVAVPFGVVTLTSPEAPLPTTALMVEEFTTVNEVAATPPNLTWVAPVKLVPIITTVAPAAALFGLNEVIVGIAM